MSDPAASPAIRLLKPLLNRQATTPRVDVDKIISELSDAARAAFSSEENHLEDFVYNTWTDIFEIAGEIHRADAAQDELSNILQRLSDTELTDKDGKVLTVPNAGEVWKDLPTFGWVAREMWNFDIRDPDNTPEQIQTFDNQSALLARLTALAHSKGAAESPLDFSLYALWAFREAFEESAQQPAASKNAAIWANYASSALQDLASKNHVLPDNTGDAGSQYSSKGWKGFSPERWNVWKSGFEDALEANAEAEQDSRDLLKKAAELM